MPRILTRTYGSGNDARAIQPIHDLARFHDHARDLGADLGVGGRRSDGIPRPVSPRRSDRRAGLLFLPDVRHDRDRALDPGAVSASRGNLFLRNESDRLLSVEPYRIPDLNEPRTRIPAHDRSSAISKTFLPPLGRAALSRTDL